MPSEGFRWDRSFELDGFWWPPGVARERELAVHGSLRFDPDTGFELQTFDFFPELEPPEQVTVFGETLAGVPCTLCSGIVAEHQVQLMVGHSRSVVRAHQAYHGAWVADREQLSSQRFELRLQGLEPWLAGLRPGAAVLEALEQRVLLLRRRVSATLTGLFATSFRVPGRIFGSSTWRAPAARITTEEDRQRDARHSQLGNN
jgi:hypothetical protein